MADTPHASEEHIDYVVVHRQLGQPRYSFRFYFIQLTAFEAGISALMMVTSWFIIDKLNLGSRAFLGIISWDILPFILLIGLPLIFSLIHHKRPDLKILETLSGAFAPTQFKDLPDKTWKPSNRRYKSRKNKLQRPQGA